MHIQTVGAGSTVASLLVAGFLCLAPAAPGHAASADPAEASYQEGLAALRAYKQGEHAVSDLLAADQKFQDALAADPDHYGACLLRAGTRLLTLVYDAEVSAMLDRLGLSAAGRDLWAWTAELAAAFPADAPTTGEALALVYRKAVPAIDDARELLGRIPADWSGSVVLTPAEAPTDNDVEIDAGDVQMFLAGLEMCRAALAAARAHDLDFDLQRLDHPPTPAAAIVVDGAAADWAGVAPLLVDAEGDHAGGTGTDISRVCTAMDASNAYILVETYGGDIHPDAVISLFLNYRPGQGFSAPDPPYDHDVARDEMYLRFSADAVLLAWTTGAVTLAGTAVARGQVFEASIPLSELGDPDFVAATYVNIWPFGLPPQPAGDPSEIGPPGLAACLDEFPLLGTITNAALFGTASNALAGAMDRYLAASALIRAEVDSQADDLVIFDPDDLDDESRFRTALTQARDSLLGCVAPSFVAELGQLLDLRRFFENPIALRDLLPGRGLQGAVVAHGLYQADWALAHLATAAPDFNQFVPAAESLAGRDAEVDGGDIAIASCMLNAAKAALHVAGAYDLDVNVARLAEKDALRISETLVEYASLLTMTNGAAMASASNCVAQAIDLYMAASTLVRGEVDPQGDDLFVIPPDEREEDDRMRAKLADVRASLSGPVAADTSRFPEFQAGEHVCLGRFFAPGYVTRAHLPRFSEENIPVAGTFPDPTFNGIFPDFDQARLAGFLGIGLVSGTVRDGVGLLPLEGVEVRAEALDGDAAWTARSDPGGLYAIALPAGDYLVSAADGMLLREYWREQRRPESADTVRAGMVANVDFTLDLGGVISGRVWRTDGTTPVGDCEILAEDYSTGERMADARTDGDGRYMVLVPAGLHRVQARHWESGWTYVNQWYQGVNTRGEAAPVSVTAAAVTPDVDFALDASPATAWGYVDPYWIEPGGEAWIIAQIEDPDGVASVTVEFTGEDGAVLGSVELFDDGLHGDFDSGDGWFANTWITPSDREGEIYALAMAVDAQGAATWIDLGWVVLDGTPPQPPEGLSAFRTDFSVRLSWAPGPDDDGFLYNVYRDGVNISNWPDSQTQYWDTVASAGTYEYRVTALDWAGNESAFSEPVEVHIGDPPEWWAEWNVLRAGAQANDYAAANSGQLKWVATQAYRAITNEYGDTAFEISTRLAELAGTDNFRAVNLGQVKWVAQPYYDWLINRGLAVGYPWTGAAQTNDYAVANVGQVKRAFGFSLK